MNFILGLLVVGGIVVGSLYLLATHVNMPADEVQKYGPQGGTSAAYTSPFSGSSGIDGVWGFEVQGVHIAGNQDNVANAGFSFTVQYGLGLDSNSCITGWVGQPPCNVCSNAPSENLNCDTLYWASDNTSGMFTLTYGASTVIVTGIGGVWTSQVVTAQTVIVQYMDDPKHPVWTPIYTNSIGLNTVNQFIDHPTGPMRFYRLGFPPQPLAVTNTPSGN